MVKTTGIVLKKFYTDKSIWTDGSYHDETSITVNGIEIEDDYDNIPDNSVVVLHGGVFVSEDEKVQDFERVFKNWLKKQKFDMIIVEVPLKEKDNIIKTIEIAGGRIIK